MGNCVSHFQLVQSQGRSDKRGVTSELPSCPALPIREPTQSYWTFPPSPIANHVSSDKFPAHADVGEPSRVLGTRSYPCSLGRLLIVIIGSGISGASFARTLLDIDQERNYNSDPLSVVMLEAQETCSGATGRWVRADRRHTYTLKEETPI